MNQQTRTKSWRRRPENFFCEVLFLARPTLEWPPVSEKIFGASPRIFCPQNFSSGSADPGLADPGIPKKRANQYQNQNDT